MQQRYYDPIIGRFYSNDPIGYTAKNPMMSFNRYLYTNNNPYKYTDPNGEFIQFVFLGVRACAANPACRTLVKTAAEQVIVAIAEAASDKDKPKKKKKKYYNKKKKKKRFDEVDGKCEYCGRDTQMDEPYQPDSAEGDHINPQAHGGETTEENQANACRECNADKSDKELGTEWTPSNPNDRIKERMKENQNRSNGS